MKLLCIFFATILPICAASGSGGYSSSSGSRNYGGHDGLDSIDYGGSGAYGNEGYNHGYGQRSKDIDLGDNSHESNDPNPAVRSGGYGNFDPSSDDYRSEREQYYSRMELETKSTTTEEERQSQLRITQRDQVQELEQEIITQQQDEFKDDDRYFPEDSFFVSVNDYADRHGGQSRYGLHREKNGIVRVTDEEGESPEQGYLLRFQKPQKLKHSISFDRLSLDEDQSTGGGRHNTQSGHRRIARSLVPRWHSDNTYWKRSTQNFQASTQRKWSTVDDRGLFDSRVFTLDQETAFIANSLLAQEIMAARLLKGSVVFLPMNSSNLSAPALRLDKYAKIRTQAPHESNTIVVSSTSSSYGYSLSEEVMSKNNKQKRSSFRTHKRPNIVARDVLASLKDTPVVGTAGNGKITKSFRDNAPAKLSEVQIAQLNLAYFNELQANASAILFPLLEGILNTTHSNSQMVYDAAWSVYSELIGTTQLVIGPFMGGMNCLGSLEQKIFPENRTEVIANITAKANPTETEMGKLAWYARNDVLADLYSEMYFKASAALNATGLLEDLTNMILFMPNETVGLAPGTLKTMKSYTQEEQHFTVPEEIRIEVLATDAVSGIEFYKND